MQLGEVFVHLAVWVHLRGARGQPTIEGVQGLGLIAVVGTSLGAVGATKVQVNLASRREQTQLNNSYNAHCNTSGKIE